MRVLVTGADGFVGHALLKALSVAGFHVVAALRRPSVSSLPEEIETRILGDLTDDSADWEGACLAVDTVVHLAGRAHVMDDPATAASLYNAVNIGGTIRLARAARRHGVSRFVFVSSIKAMGEETAPGVAWDEAAQPHPEDAYGQSKLEAEQALLAMHAEDGFPCVVLRPPLMYGTGMKGNLRSLMNAVIRGWPLPLGGIENRRSLLDVNSFASAMIQALSHPAAPGKTYLVADKIPLSIGQIVTAMAHAVRKRPRVFSLPTCFWNLARRLPFAGPRIRRLTGSLVLNAAKIESELGWKPADSPIPGFQAAFASLGAKFIQR